tara:strand:+ start:561 stop:761 length:201 start_codon:yes stop_codon:yes gene_type:complete
MCFGGTKQPTVAVRPDPTIKFVEGNIKDPKDDEGMGFENPVSTSTDKKKKSSVSTSSSDLSIPTSY